jgi:acetoin utilization deacetylase AcuC-like enzyme
MKRVLQKLKIVYSDKVKLHDPKFYFNLGKMDEFPEMPTRVTTVYEEINNRKLGEIHSPIDFGFDPILRVHSRNYVDYVESGYKRWLEMGGDPNGLLPDTFACRLDPSNLENSRKSNNIMRQAGAYSYDASAVIAKDTFLAAYEAAQVTLTGASNLVEAGQNTFALCRPPGHHSSEQLAGGFCFFNNAAIAAQYIIDKTSKRVAILDVDYHHGNGTQSIFYRQENPLFVSLHGDDDYPFYWGSAEEKGEGPGLGFNVNRPLPAGTKDAEYMSNLEELINTVIKPYNPQYLIVSLGVDTFSGDPVGTFDLSSPCFTKIGQLIKTISVPTLFVMEGGYAVKELGINVCNVLSGFKE